eukprot:2779939-Prymnesium_polylepis.1
MQHTQSPRTNTAPEMTVIAASSTGSPAKSERRPGNGGGGRAGDGGGRTGGGTDGGPTGGGGAWGGGGGEGPQCAGPPSECMLPPHRDRRGSERALPAASGQPGPHTPERADPKKA